MTFRVWQFSLSLALAAATCSVQAYQAGDWLVRGGIANIDPDSSSDAVALNGGALPDSGVSVGSDTQLGITISYYYSPSWSVELLASTPFTHEIDSTGSTLAGLGINEVGETTHLPPTLSGVYTFDLPGAWKPYVGAGVNYTAFYDEEASGQYKAALGNDASLSLDDSVGLALQAGIDWELGGGWIANASLRWIQISTDAELVSNSGTTRVTTSVDIDPWVYQLNLGYVF